MAGGALEYVMANMVENDGSFSVGNSKITAKIDTKYYDRYLMSTNSYDFTRAHLGDALREALKTLDSYTGHWYEEHSYIVYNSSKFLIRGGQYRDGINVGIFSSGVYGNGAALGNITFRCIITAQDGNE